MSDTPETTTDTPAASKLTVKRVKAPKDTAVVAVAKDDVDASVPADGTRMETDAGPVQGVNIMGEPREVEIMEFPGLTIRRERY